ncbi:MAG: hypothetical protein U0694_09410 [Anaerolineae bacterium]
MKDLSRILSVLLVLLVFVSAVSAQEDCPAIVEQALSTASDVCAETGRNQACYGNVDLTAALRPDVDSVQFEDAGDITDLTNITGLTLSGMDEENGTWGVAVLQVQANLPDTLPGQNVMMLLFGDVEITDANAEGDAESDSAGNPMQAFYFRSGIGDAPCAEAPNSGILIQTPEGAGTIDLTMNDVSITLGSTAYVQAQPEGDMVFSVIEGDGTVEAEGVSRDVPAGTRVTVAIDENLHAEEPPSEAEPYDAEALGALPIDLLPREIEIAGPESTPDAGGAIELASGTWRQTVETMEGCGVNSSMISSMPNSEFDIAGSDIERLFDGSEGPIDIQGTSMEVTIPDPNVYVVAFSIGEGTSTTTYTIISSTHIEFTSETTAAGCTIVTTGVLEYIGD